MARVLIQQGVERLEAASPSQATDRFRAVLEQQGRRSGPRLQGAPPRLRLRRARD